VPAVLEEIVGIDGDNTSLIGLGNVSKDAIDHRDKHSVLVRVTGVLNDGDDVGTFLGNTDEITSGSVGEFNSIHQTFRSNNICHV